MRLGNQLQFDQKQMQVQHPNCHVTIGDTNKSSNVYNKKKMFTIRFLPQALLCVKSMLGTWDWDKKTDKIP